MRGGRSKAARPTILKRTRDGYSRFETRRAHSSPADVNSKCIRIAHTPLNLIAVPYVIAIRAGMGGRNYGTST
jgi:hypothetical protein